MPDQVSARQALSDAVRYWEPRRLIYNAVLLSVVAASYLSHEPGTHVRVSVDSLLILFVLAVLANVAYCACYVVDIAAQLTVYRRGWLRFRVLLLALGLAFASTLAYFFSWGVFAV